MNKVIDWTIGILIILFGFTTNKYLGVVFFVVAVILAFAQEKIKNQEEEIKKYEEKKDEKNK